ncbi:MAG TPA: EAL domain-containing protein [Jatrophihabitans sp.]|jgi:EAL domain-containing protein (putative c-di-GMP-specific phosphodiesterase class I)
MLQPIVEVSTGKLIAAEALARFPEGSPSPQATFEHAHAAGWGADLEAACLRRALGRRHDMPDGVMLSVNLSPDALAAPGVRDALDCDLTGLIVEVTEPPLMDPEVLNALLADFRRRGALIAVDDLSIGYAGLLRLTTLRPDIVKLDRSLVTAVRDNPAKVAVIRAVSGLARWIDARLVAEGVETLDDLSALAELDVDYVQGWVIAPPDTDLPQASPQSVAACRIARQGLLEKASSPRRGLGPDVSAVTAALASSSQLADLQGVLASAASELGFDVIGLSTLTSDDHLHEIVAFGNPVDPTRYALDDFPATRAAMATGVMLEAHIEDQHTDHAERALLTDLHLASVLIVPLSGEGAPLGILEFSHRTTCRWTSRQLEQARILADHLAPALLRMSQDRVVNVRQQAAERSAYAV